MKPKWVAQSSENLFVGELVQNKNNNDKCIDHIESNIIHSKMTQS